MIIFEYNKTPYVYIHIPKNNGKYIRNLIRTQYSILQKFWHIDHKNNIDLAHIPYALIKNYTDMTDYRTISFIRNPYDRIISAFFYKNNNTTSRSSLNRFIKNKLSNIRFDNNFDYKYIHYYPQYLFINKDTEIISFKTISNNDIVGSIKIQMKDYQNKSYILSDYLDPESIDICYKIYKPDFILYEKANNV